MKKVLVTGAQGFIGKNLREALARQEEVLTICFDLDDDPKSLAGAVLDADLIFHLAGINRPQSEEEFVVGNVGLTASIIDLLVGSGKNTPLVLTSSTQALLDNPYGASKRSAEELVFAYGEKCAAPVHVYRLTNVFGKWCRPNYNSAVATFCHNIARGLDITVSDTSRELDLVYIDDVVAEFIEVLQGRRTGDCTASRLVAPTHRVTLGDLVARIYSFKEIRSSLLIPNLADPLTRCLHATYLSYLEPWDFSYSLDWKTDDRGSLAELIKSEHFGQMFVSKTHSGVLRGNHYHNTKIEKFCVLQGEAVIEFRHVLGDEVISYPVSGQAPVVVDIPPGYTHSIRNVSAEEMIVIFWANQVFDPKKPDTYYCEVQRA